MQQQASGIMGAKPNTQGNSADASLGGMAQAVDTKVEAYRNNPQALEKRLSNNQQLLDLLALQKVKSEKEAAKNQLILSEQQVPSTILEQREQEVLAMNKDDLAKQTAGILGERQKQKQKEMSRPPMPQGAPQGAPQQPPIRANRGGLMPLPRPNMKNMAQGGIMGYQAGGDIDAETEKKLKDKLGSDWQKKIDSMSPEAIENMARGLGIRASIVKGLKNTRIGSIASLIAGLPSAVGRGIDSLRSSPIYQAITTDYGGEKPGDKEKEDKTPLTEQDILDAQGGVTGDQKAAAEAKKAEEAEAERIRLEELAAPVEIKDDPPSISDQAEEIISGPAIGGAPAAGTGGAAAIGGAPAAGGPSKGMPAAAQTISQKLGQPFMEQLQSGIQGTTNETIRAGAKQAAEDSNKDLGREDKAKTMQGGIDSLKNMTKAAQDPKKLRLDRLKAMFAGGAKGGAQGVMQAEINSDRQEQQFGFSKLRETTNRENEKIAADIDIGRIGQTARNAVFGALTTASSDAMLVQSNITEAEIVQADKAADRIIAAKQQVIDNKLAALEIKLSEQRTRIIEKGNNQTTLLTLAQLLNDYEKELTAIASTTDVGGAELYEKAEQYKKDNNGEDMSMNAADAAILHRYVALKDKIRDTSKQEKQLREDIKKMSGASDSTVGTI